MGGWGEQCTGRKSSEAHEHVILGLPGRGEQGCVEIGGTHEATGFRAL